MGRTKNARIWSRRRAEGTEEDKEGERRCMTRVEKRCVNGDVTVRPMACVAKGVARNRRVKMARRNPPEGLSD